MAELSSGAAELLEAMRRGEKVSLVPHPQGQAEPYFVRANFVNCTESAKALIAHDLARIEGHDSWSKALVLIDQEVFAKQRAAEKQAEKVARMTADVPGLYETLRWLLSIVEKSPKLNDLSPADKSRLQTARSIVARVEGKVD
ncbi:MAG TPA: hypothetical protein VGE52_04135 [Pirellulales bacterium]